MLHLPDALAPLAAFRQFIVYVLVPSQTRPGKTDKFPIDYRTGRMPIKGGGGAHDPAIWTDFQTASNVAAALGSTYGVGFVFTRADPFFFIDIDKCFDRAKNDWSDLAKSLVAAFPGAAVEVSSSCEGLHIIGTGIAPPHAKRCEPYGLEFYTEARFVALTGTNAVGSAATDCSHLLPALVHQFFKPTTDSTGAAPEWTSGPCEGWNGPEDDEQLLDRMLRSQSAGAAFGNKAAFRDLWDCNVEVLAAAYPDASVSGSTPYNASQADAALAQHLAFWTGRDCDRIKRLMFLSALNRPKWERDDYIDGTILKAISQQIEFLTDKEPEPVAGIADRPPTAPNDPMPSEPPRATAVTGSTFLAADQQIDMFKGCVYIIDQNRALVPGGLLLKPDQFRVMYGGYTFQMDYANERTSRDAWEAFTQSQAYRSPRANTTCFKPNLPPAMIVHDAGRSRANIWWPVEVRRIPGDATPFIQHLHKVLPHGRDAEILLAYMAACVQHKGVKFQWAPLIQGVEGNGKTFFTRCVAEAVGQRYTHMPPSHEISEKFNSWLFGNVFIGVEDIYVPDQKKEIFEILKPMITSDTLAKRAMNTDQIMTDVVCNFIFNTNHKNGMKKTRNDRRVCPMYTAQQNADDLVRDGMTPEYFRKFYAWARADGYAIISDLLHEYPIPDELNPAGAAIVAPLTTSTEEAINEGLGGAEQEILEAIAQGLPGFAGGWVSSMALDRLLDRVGASRRVQINRRRDMMLALGYEWHPGLADGRVNNVVLPDAGKPRLYIHRDNPLRSLRSPGDIARAYSDAQGPTAQVPH